MTYRAVDLHFKSHYILSNASCFNSQIEVQRKLVYQRNRCRERFLHSNFLSTVTITVRVLLMQERRSILFKLACIMVEFGSFKTPDVISL